ncbi:D-TA family PLP-dependent enzyme [Chitinophagaceae bacterium LB-8]|uniref:D-TA family PLP-dependent enzyme n=1 Tax=Paraflavisolibacter caeni TaxID=2982496 RepID=A0A9X2XWI2_9BACT|nr:D-TA family PLP-dependent enzyme [Paraflavisolibacter caeni]MCU7549976.1 D-TA family PLP-dependent enzyme [Paraflavisolibacter caeni]
MTENPNWYTINNISEFDSPALLIYLDRVQNNIAQIKGMIDDVARLRPHVKTHKTKEASLLLMEAGIRKFKCATIAEAEMLADIEAPDVLLAYQPVGPKIERFISLVITFPATRFSCLVDDYKVAQQLSERAVEANLDIPVYLDVNVGMNRTGVIPDKAIDLYTVCSYLEGITPIGLHVYDGHIGDKDFEKRKQQCDEAYALVEELKKQLMKAGLEKPIIIAGGSPTFPIHAQRKKVECSPGTFIFWDDGYTQKLSEQPFQTAALVLTRIISLPSETMLCTDLGHKSIAAENPLGNRVSFLNAPDLKVISQSEEHLVLQAEKGHHYKVGDVLYGLPYHICPTCALYEKGLVVENGSVTNEWPIISRNRKILF